MGGRAGMGYAGDDWNLFIPAGDPIEFIAIDEAPRTVRFAPFPLYLKDYGFAARFSSVLRI
jgi:hypothetical protein